MRISTAIVAVGLLVFVIIIHELGHFAAAKLCGIPVKSFSFGFGKKLFGITLAGTEFMVSMFPLGGYVSVEGENGLGGGDYLMTITVWKRFCYFAGGVVFNVLTAFFATTSAQYFVRSAPIGQVLHVVQGDSPLASGDRILVVEAVPVREGMPESIASVLDKVKGNFADLQVERRSGAREKLRVPLHQIGAEKRMGVLLSKGTHGKPATTILWESAGAGFWATGTGFTVQLKAIWGLMTGKTKDAKLMGPIQVGVTTYKMLVNTGNLLIFLGIVSQISLALVIMNLLPVPGLDGWFIGIAGIEMVRRRPLSEPFMRYSLHYGYLVLISLLVAVLGMDIFRTFMMAIGKG